MGGNTGNAIAEVMAGGGGRDNYIIYNVSLSLSLSLLFLFDDAKSLNRW
jgi:hypothetical protein